MELSETNTNSDDEPTSKSTSNAWFFELFFYNINFHNGIWSSLPYKWEAGPKTSKETPKQKRNLRIRLILVALYCMGLCLQMLKIAENEEISLGKKFQTVGFLTVWLTVAGIRLDFTDYESIPKFVKSVMEFEKQLSTSEFFRITKLDKVLAKILWPCVPVSFGTFVVGASTLLIIKPCTAPFMGSMFSYCEGGAKGNRPWYLFIVTGMEIVYLIEMTSVASFYVCGLTFAGILSILKYISVLKAKLEDAGRTGNASKNIDVFKKYRILCIVVELFNECFQKRILPSIATGAPLIQTMGMFVVIKFHDRLGTGQIMAFSIMAFDGFVANILIFTFASFINVKCTELLGACKTVNSRNITVRTKYVQKCYRSCWALKIKLASNNFVERATPLIVQNLCFSQVSTMLISTN